MMAKKKPVNEGIVFSTNPDFAISSGDWSEHATLEPGQQKLKVRKDSKNRAGKMATVIEGFIGKQADLEELAKKLKTYCGTGGSAKEGIMIIQGDQQAKAVQWLIENGYPQTKRG
jgi:translation initiation factor 1